MAEVLKVAGVGNVVSILICCLMLGECPRSDLLPVVPTAVDYKHQIHTLSYNAENNSQNIFSADRYCVQSYLCLRLAIRHCK